MSAGAQRGGRALEGFEHEAVFYEGAAERADVLARFVGEGLERGEPVLAVISGAAAADLRDALGADAESVEFVDMEDLGANPARIIPAWWRFLDAHGGPARGIGEPVWAGRRHVETAEAILHEGLLNLAFEAGPAWRLLCPYDAGALPDCVLKHARETHPVLHGTPRDGVRYGGPELARTTFTSWLSDAPGDALAVDFDVEDLAGLRALVRRVIGTAGISGSTAEDLVLAVHELAANSVLHGGGRGTLLSWQTPEELAVEVRDGGCIDDPLVGREVPDFESESGRGVWMANQLCDLVQVRSNGTGTQVRVHAWR